MFIPDMPNVPPQDMPVMIAQANQAQPSDVTTTRTMGVCRIMANAANANFSLENTIIPKVSAGGYLYLYEHQMYEQQKIATSPATITILQNPKHGTLADNGSGVYAYLPEKGYLGKDSATVLVDIGGIKVRVVYFFQTLDVPTVADELDESLCKKGPHWKISTTLDPNGTSTLTSVEYQSPMIDAGATTTATLAATLSSSLLSTLSVDPSSVTFNLADLSGGAVGQAVGNTITLDDNAAGHNWFIDTTPSDNSEYLPTSNPYE